MYSMSSRLSRALAVGVTLAASAGGTAAVAGPASAAPRIPPNDEATGKPTPPIPSVQDPDVAVDLQLLAQCPTPEQLTALHDRLSLNPGEQAAREAFNRRAVERGTAPLKADQVLLPRRDVRVGCEAGRVRIGVFAGGIAKSPELSLARDKGLARVDLADRLQSAIRVHPRVTEQLERLTGTALHDKETASRKFSVFGPKGPRVRFTAPNAIVTTVKGKDTRPFPDVSFQTTITDTMSVQDGTFQCTTTAKTKANTRVQKALFALSLLTAPANGGVLAGGFGAQLALIERGVAAQNRKPADAGPGCLLLKEVFVSNIPIPGGGKLLFNYSKASVENGGLVARFVAAPSFSG